MSAITSLTIVYTIVYSGADQRNHQSSASLALVRGIQWWPVNSTKRPVTRNAFDDVVIQNIVSKFLQDMSPGGNGCTIGCLPWLHQNPWWRHQMETFSALLVMCEGNPPVTAWFPSQRPATRGFDFFFNLRLNKLFNKQSLCWWIETPSRSLWLHCCVV